jgi:hypothetical protein
MVHGHSLRVALNHIICSGSRHRMLLKWFVVDGVRVVVSTRGRVVGGLAGGGTRHFARHVWLVACKKSMEK